MLPFKLWVDADALPKILREVILRASDRYQLEVTFVANQNVGIIRRGQGVITLPKHEDTLLIGRVGHNLIVAG